MRKLPVLVCASLVMLSLVLVSGALAAEKAGTVKANVGIADTNSRVSTQQVGAASAEATADCTYSGPTYDGYFCGAPPVVSEITFSKTGSEACSYDATIDWGDGSTTTLTDVQDQQKESHTYTDTGVYILQITGTVHSSDPNVTCTFKDSTLIVEVTGPPRVSSVNPAENETNVSRSTDVTANFSEAMDPNTVKSSTFKLYKWNPKKKVWQRVTAISVSCSNDPCTTANLDPYPSDTSQLLAANRKYKAVITTGAQDLAGNALDQRPDVAGNQPKVWNFTTESS